MKNPSFVERSVGGMGECAGLEDGPARQRRNGLKFGAAGRGPGGPAIWSEGDRDGHGGEAQRNRQDRRDRRSVEVSDQRERTPPRRPWRKMCERRFCARAGGRAGAVGGRRAAVGKHGG